LIVHLYSTPFWESLYLFNNVCNNHKRPILVGLGIQ